MKMQLSPITATTIANSRPSCSTPQQRQGAIVDKSVEEFVQMASTKHPEEAKELHIVLEGMKLASDDLTTIMAENTKNAYSFTISPGKSKYSYIVSAGGKAILAMFNRMLEDLQSPRT